MAIYNLGQLQEYDVGSGISEALKRFGEGQQKRNLLQQQIAGQKEIADIDKATQLEIAAARARAEQNEKDKTYFDTMIELGIDKYGREAFSKIIESDPGTKEVFTRYLVGHPEYKGIEPSKVIASITTKKEVEQKYTQQAEEIKATIEAKKPLTPTQLGNAAYLAEMVMRAPGGDPKARRLQYQETMRALGEYQKGMIESMKTGMQPGFQSFTQPSNAGSALYSGAQSSATPIAEAAKPGAAALKVDRFRKINK